MWAIWRGIAVLLLLAGCNGRESFLLRVTFPDDAARDQAGRLRVVAINPEEESGCSELMLGQAFPGEAGYAVESEVSFDWPAGGKIRGLEDVSSGRKLFYAEAEDAGGEVFLRGCTPAQVGEQEAREVVVALERLGQLCQSDADCPVCQECDSAGFCTNQPAGAACDDGDSCSSQDACDGAGACVGGATDKDADGDGYYDEACPGGDDCDDDAFPVNPGASEGPYGDPTCSDGVDNDCDGQTDDCTAPEGYRKSITIDFNQVSGGSDLPNFPVLISIAGDDDLRTTENGGHVESPSGYDITFRAADGATQLDHEIEEYDPAGGILVAWVRIPVLSASADTVIYLYYGYSGVTSPTENPGAVWDGNYVGVWHLTEDSADTGAVDLYEDSTANMNHGDDYVSATAKAGQVLGGQAFDGVDDYVDCGSNTVLDVDYLTVEFWLNVNTWINDGGVIAKGDNSYRQYWIWTYDGQVAFEIDEGGNINYAWAPTAGSWEHLAIIYDGADVTTYRNGLQENTYLQATGVIDPSAPPLLLGFIPSFHYADFALDELRISNTARPVGWIATGYNNQSSPSGFYRIGAEETL